MGLVTHEYASSSLDAISLELRLRFGVNFDHPIIMI